MVQRHSDLQPSILNYYRKACPSLPQSLSAFIAALGLVDLKAARSLKFEATCEQILNTGNLISFAETWEEMENNGLY